MLFFCLKIFFADQRFKIHFSTFCELLRTENPFNFRDQILQSKFCILFAGKKGRAQQLKHEAQEKWGV